MKQLEKAKNALFSLLLLLAALAVLAACGSKAVTEATKTAAVKARACGSS